MIDVPRIDLLLHGGRIWTGCEDLPDQADEVSAVAVRDGRVVAAGSDEELRPLATESAAVIDLEGRRAVPGLIDSHIHAVRAGLTWDRIRHWESLRTTEECLADIRLAARTAPPGTWITAIGGWRSEQLDSGRAPTPADLDAAAPHHPVYLQEMYERGLLNTAGLRTCGWDRSSPDPERGALERDADGHPTGVITGVGAFAVPVALALTPDADEAVASTRSFLTDLAATGLTGVHDGFGLLLTPEDYRPLYELWRRDGLALRVRLFVSAWERGNEVQNVTDVVRLLQPGSGDAMLRIAGLGEIGHLGCHDLEGLAPFEIDAETHAELVEITRTCARAGWPMSLHAVRDQSLSRILDAWEQVEAETGMVRGRRWSIVHADQASPANLDRIARLGAGILVQNRAMLMAARYRDAWGEDDVRRMPPIGDMRARGIPLGGGTDATRANWYSPWASIGWMVTGRTLGDGPDRDPQHRMPVAEALASYTRGAAWFTGEEGSRGRLAPGYDADLCVPTADPFGCDPDELREISSELTVVGGRVTHAAGGPAPSGG